MPSMLGAVKLALAWEERARDTYQAWARETGNINAKQLFLNLAKMESRHVSSLQRLDVKKDITVDLSGNEWLDLTKGLASYPTASDRTLKAIFDYATAKEEEAMKRYATLAEQTRDKKLKAFFQDLAAEEKHHKALIKEQEIRLLRPF